MCRRGDPPYTFVTEGIERAVEQARTAAGEKNVALMGATIVQQCRPQPGGVEIRAGLHTGEAELFGAKLSAGSTGSRGASGAGRRIWAPMVSRRARTPLLTGAPPRLIGLIVVVALIASSKGPTGQPPNDGARR